jgi:hypothetical protein
MDSCTPLCLFTGRVESRDGEYVLTILEQETELGTLEPGDTYRVGVYPGISTSPATTATGRSLPRGSARPTGSTPAILTQPTSSSLVSRWAAGVLTDDNATVLA